MKCDSTAKKKKKKRRNKLLINSITESQMRYAKWKLPVQNLTGHLILLNILHSGKDKIARMENRYLIGLV